MPADQRWPQGPIYLDYNATTPVDPQVLEAMLPYFDAQFGNPSSSHGFGTAPKEALERARRRIGALIGAPDGDIVFTGSGSEANALALRGVVLGGGRSKPQIITAATEHPAVLATCAALARWHGVEILTLPVDAYGVVDPAALEAAITPRTALVSIMIANNETGTVAPIVELARVAHARGVLFHTDAAQAVGKLPVDVQTLGVDLLTIVGHKMYAPKGVGALYVGPGITLEPIMYGGGQERGRRAGTENVAFAVGLGAAADLALQELEEGYADRIRTLRERLHHRLLEHLGERVELNGHPTGRLPNTLNISIAGTLGDRLLGDAPGVAASTGSACHSGTTEPSPVLQAMGLTRPRSLAALRLSLGRWSTADDVDRAAAQLAAAALSVAVPR